MAHKLESATIEVVVKDQTFTFDLLEMEIFLEENVDGKKPSEFVPDLMEFFKAKTGELLTFSQTLAFADKVRLAYLEYKKKYEEGLRSDFPSASTLSNSMNENTSYSETNSPD